MKTYSREIKRVSRWITINEKPITAKHSLYCYADKDENEKTAYLFCFRFGGRLFALNQFAARFGMMGFDRDCEKYPAFISGYDGDGDIFNPLMCELSPDGEKIRLYTDTTTAYYHL